MPHSATLTGLLRDAGAALGRHDPAAALRALAAAEAADPGAAEVYLTMALAWRMAGDPAAGLAALDRLLVRDPEHFVALLSKASLIEAVRGPRHAARAYRTALRLAPDAATLPAGLAAAVQHGHALLQADAAALLDHLQAATAPLRATAAGADLARFDESQAVFAGTARPYVQKPMLLHYGRLPAIPFHDRAQFPWLAELEAATPMILAELQGLLASAAEDFAPYIQFPPATAVNQWGALNHSRRWSSYFLWHDGVRHDAACERCPGTAALMERLPLMRQDGFAPTVVFSALEPHTHIPPHTGSTTTRLLVHLPLILPGPARFRVGNEVREWRLGEAWVFDDTIEHEAWNDADAMRVILIIDIWTPLLSEPERALVAAMMDARKAYYAG